MVDKKGYVEFNLNVKIKLGFGVKSFWILFNYVKQHCDRELSCYNIKDLTDDKKQKEILEIHNKYFKDMNLNKISDSFFFSEKALEVKLLLNDYLIEQDFSSEDKFKAFCFLLSSSYENYHSSTPLTVKGHLFYVCSFLQNICKKFNLQKKELDTITKIKDSLLFNKYKFLEEKKLFKNLIRSKMSDIDISNMCGAYNYPNSFCFPHFWLQANSEEFCEELFKLLLKNP